MLKELSTNELSEVSGGISPIIIMEVVFLAAAAIDAANDIADGFVEQWERREAADGGAS